MLATKANVFSLPCTLIIYQKIYNILNNESIIMPDS